MIRALVLFVVVGGMLAGDRVAYATGPGIVVGRAFEEEFTDGFDHPEAVSESANLTFVPGRVMFGAEGHLVYDFNYAPVTGPYGPVEPNVGSFWVELYDEQVSDTELMIRIHAEEGLPPHGVGLTLEILIAGGTIKFSAWHSGGGPYSAEVAQAPGHTRIEIGPDFQFWFPVIEDVGGIHELESLWLPAVKPAQLTFSGTGLELESVTMHSYIFVDNDAASIGRIKGRY